MSTDQPSGSGDEPPRGSSGPAQPPPSGGNPYGTPPPPGGGGVPPGGSPAGDPYGGGAADPLAGMPPLAPLPRRLAARIIDALLVAIPLSIVLWPTTGAYDVDDTAGSAWQQVAYALVYFVYEGIMLSLSGQTVGKKVMKVRVAMLENGAVPHGVPAWLRSGVYSLPLVVPCCGSVFWLVNVLWCTWDRPYRQCLHDKAVRTVVVDAR